MELPDSPWLEAQLSRNGNVPDWREQYTYQLGLMAFYDKCMNDRVRQGIIYYYIKWQVDEDHLATSPIFEFADLPPEGVVSEDDKLAFAACVKEYLAMHDQVVLAHAGQNGMAWGMGAVFPLSDSNLLKMIAGAKSDGEAGASGSAAARPSSAADRR